MVNNMILGLGTDIIEISRIEKATKSEHFVKRVFTPNEIEYAKTKSNKAQTYAGLFCAKESIVKALGTGFRELKFHDIEILHDDLGKPYVKNFNMIISISHSNEYATATAIYLK